MYDSFRILVLLLVLLPLAAAIVLPLFGRFARRPALYVAILHLVASAAIVFGVVIIQEERTSQISGGRDLKPQVFRPEFVPGDPGITGTVNTSTNRTAWTLFSLTDTAAFDPAARSTKYLAGPHVQFFLGVDGLNLWLVVLSSLMMFPAILVSWDSTTERPGAFYGWLFLLQGGTVGAFLSFDVILFYIFFELTLIPAYFLIARWGNGSGRRDAARKFFLYTLAGSLLTLIGIIGVVLTNPDPLTGQHTFSLPDLMNNVQLRLLDSHIAHLKGVPDGLESRHNIQMWLFVALIAGFLVKTPVWPFHTWLPSAYNEAPLGVTILLSSVLAKLGAYGILRFVLTLTPDAAIAYGLPVIGSFAAFGIVYGAFCAFGQRDIKLMIAYSSISHLGFLVLGLFAFNAEGLTGAALHMINHGVSTGAMFALLAFFLHRYRTTDMRQFGGLMGRYPKFTFLAFFICMASIGLPGLNNFVSEMMMLAGLVDARNEGSPGIGYAVIAAVSIFLSAWYVLTMLQRVFFNEHREPPPQGSIAPADVNRHELYTLGGLAALCLFLGLFPQLLITTMKPDVMALSSIGDLARDRVAGRMPEFEQAPPPKSTMAPKQLGAPKKKGGKGGP
ncbi:MAG TPA: NADH-quinone oxidoreductase subunit M [Urbifossiella sp.]